MDQTALAICKNKKIPSQQHNPFVMTHGITTLCFPPCEHFSFIDLRLQLTLLTPPKLWSGGKTVETLETQKSSPELGPAPLLLLLAPPLPELLLPPPSPDGEAPLPLDGFTGCAV
jgi:hypothetical protein